MRRTTSAEASHFTVTQIFGYDSAVKVEASIDPISLQTDSERKKTFQSALAEAVKVHTDRIFTGDVKAEITWFVPEERRYSTHLVADIDNIIKPLFDAVTGPNGIMIDDNQVQQVAASWLDVQPDEYKFWMRVTALDSNEFIKRKNLRFVDFGRPYGCMLLPSGPDLLRPILVGNFARAIHHHQEQIANGVEPAVAKRVMPIQRSYPLARLKGFEVETYSSSQVRQ